MISTKWSDVLATAAAPAVPEEWIAGRGKSGLERIPDHAAQSSVELELVDLVLHIGHAVAGDGVQNLLNTGSCVGVDRSGVHRTIIPKLVDIPVRGAAAVGDLALKGADAVGDLSGQRGGAGTHIALGLESKLCLLVKATAHSVLQIVEVHGIAQASLGDRVSAASAEESVSAPQHGENEQSKDPESASAKAEAVPITGRASGLNGHGEGSSTFHHSDSPLQNIYIQLRVHPEEYT